MQLAPMRFTKIEGTAVVGHVTSAEEAKAALKELRHKKRELKFLRGALAKQQQGMRPARGKGQAGAQCGLATLLDVCAGASRRCCRARGRAAEAKPRKPTPAEIERELRELDETLHNIEGCILQLQGKLLTRGERDPLPRRARRHASAAASSAKSATIRSGWCGVSPNGRLRRSMKAVRMP